MTKHSYVTQSLSNIRMKMPYFLPIYLIAFQIIFVLLYAFFGTYEHSFNAEMYNSFVKVHTMILFGFAFLMAFLKHYGYGSIGFTFLLVSYTLQWSLLVRWFFEQTLDAKFTNWTLEISPLNLISADYCVAAVLVSFGALIGKVSLSQVIVMATIEVVIQCFNEYICTYFLIIHDIGHSILTFTFGVCFGITVSLILYFTRVDSEKETSSYNSNILSLIGTLIFWLYWPHFNSATAAQGIPQSMAIVNTFLAMMGSCTATFIISTFVTRGRLNIIHIRNATIAGGVAIGAIADLPVQPFVALLIGLTAGAISTICYQYATNFFKRVFINDTCGIISLFGIPSLISGLLSAVIAPILNKDNFDEARLYQVYPARNYLYQTAFNNITSLIRNSSRNPNQTILNNLASLINQNNTTVILNNITTLVLQRNETETGRSGFAQGGFQILALCHTICISILFGIITGILINIAVPNRTEDSDDTNLMFDDEIQWICPEDYSLELAKTEVFSGEEGEELIEQKPITTRFVQEHADNRARS